MNINYSYLLSSSNLPRLEARLILQHVSSLSHAKLIADSETEVSLIIQEKFWQMVNRRKAGEPIAYLLGYREFYGRKFLLSNAVLIPRPETEHLLEAALERLDKNKPCRVLDLGTGSGVLAISLALEAKAWQVFASDLEIEALQVAEQNNRLLSANVSFYQGDWFAAIPHDMVAFDLIVSNPPYIANYDEHLYFDDLRFEPKTALTDFADGLSCLQNIISKAMRYLQPSGWLMLEHGYQQGSAVRDLLQSAGFQQIETLLDLAGLERVSIGRKA